MRPDRPRWLIRASALAILLVGVDGADARWDPMPLVPVDEAAQEPALDALRSELISAAERRDATAVRAALAPSEFPASYAVDTAQQFDSLKKALSLGGSFTRTKGAKKGRREFCAPYVYSTWPLLTLPLELDEGGDKGPAMAVVARDVPVRARPDPDAAILTYVSYEIVGVPGEAYPYDGRPVQWQAINTPSHGKGFVPPSVLRSPDDEHVCFAQFEGRWLITWFGR